MIEQISPGTNFSHQREAAAAIQKVFSDLCASPPDLISVSANGTFIDAAEQAAIEKHSPNARVYAVKQAVGESVGASSLWQTIAAAQALITQQLPGKTAILPNAVISTCGLNQQAAGLRLILASK